MLACLPQGKGRMHASLLRRGTPVKEGIKTAAVALFGTAAKVLPSKGHAILTYHSLDGLQTVVSTPPWAFRAQMNHLKSRGFHVTSVELLIEHLKRGIPIPRRTVFLTFDDGLQNIHSTAFPILKELGFQATVFLATDYVGGKAQWYEDAGIPALPMLTWDQIEEMREYGIDFQAHTRSHPHLPQLSPERAEEEMRSSKDVIERRLRRPVAFFAYPFGEYTPELMERARSAGFAGACTTEVGLFVPGQHRYAIKRMGLNYSRVSTPRQAVGTIDACVGGTFAWYRRAARSINRLRVLSAARQR